MKKLLVLLSVFMLAFTLQACNTNEEENSNGSEDVTDSDNQDQDNQNNECDEEDVEEVIQQYFYAEQFFEASGYTPAYMYFVSGALNEDETVANIRFDMVSGRNVSKRSTDYLMNIAHVTIGGEIGNQTLEVFIGGSTENIPQVYNYVRGTISAEGTEKFTDLGLFGMFAPYTGDYAAEIFGALSTGLDIEITDETTVKEVLSAMGLWNETTDNARNTGTGNARKTIPLVGRYGGGTFDQQLVAIENYIVDNGLTLAEVYALLSTNNQGYDNRDAITGATMLFEPKILEVVAKAAGITITNEAQLLGVRQEETNKIVTVAVQGWNEITVEVTFNSLNEVSSVIVLSHTETPGYGEDVIESNYIDDLVTNANDLSELDAVSGATKTADALKEAVQAAIDYINS